MPQTVSEMGYRVKRSGDSGMFTTCFNSTPSEKADNGLLSGKGSLNLSLCGHCLFRLKCWVLLASSLKLWEDVYNLEIKNEMILGRQYLNAGTTLI